ncbi:hypothetical protein BIV57_14315 [Mangrovactinospora gilvigrisea]|uniref:Uncharacterized protein n=1 Tax=Mangrovactinospora gilvigrisea TaxID=1428644 RepID=A0A1J7CB10_9ACTN|nr:hypothetical protein [Mangrovactinospora gilvigrisea]OIV36834.1 hypothetical protein BIV57_14315 [Mangrovactinospora gilvigrisea]
MAIAWATRSIQWSAAVDQYGEMYANAAKVGGLGEGETVYYSYETGEPYLGPMPGTGESS